MKNLKTTASIFKDMADIIKSNEKLIADLFNQHSGFKTRPQRLTGK